MRVAVLNSGSSSIKYQVIDMAGPDVIASGLVERIGENEGRIVHHPRAGAETRSAGRNSTASIPDHATGFALLMEGLEDVGPLDAIGHRVVHGGEAFRQPARIDAEVLETIRSQEPLAPLHNPANRVGIEAAMAACPGVPQVAVFDTAFHQTMPPKAYLYALPAELYSGQRVRRYGFHGTSHAYVTRRTAAWLDRPVDELNAIVLHLGNGASATAIKDGISVDTSMGLTPLEGLVMGTRSGDVDPAIHAYLQRTTGMGLAEIDDLLNRHSGLKGLCGENDMRTIVDRRAQGDEQARLAFDIFCYRARKYVGAYAAVVGRLDALVFTAGIGEHSPPVRAGIAGGLEALGMQLDTSRNENPGGLPADVSTAGSRVRILVVPTNEELEIARQTLVCLET